MRKSVWFRGGLLIGLLAVPLALYGAANGENAVAETGLLLLLGLLAVVTVWTGK